MGIKVFLVVVVVLVEVWVGDCCKKHCEANGAYSSCHMRKRRSTTLMNVMKSENLTRIGTQFSIYIEDNPCVFETYDIDNDGRISKDELEIKFGVKKEVTDLFAFINTKGADTVISFPEFCAAIPQLISECEGCSYD